MREKRQYVRPRKEPERRKGGFCLITPGSALSKSEQKDTALSDQGIERAKKEP